MIVVAIGYCSINPDRDSVYGIINNRILERNRKYGDSLRKIECKNKNKVIDKIENKTKNNTTKRGINETITASNGRYAYIEVKKFTIMIEGNISKNVINTYKKCDNIPSLWNNIFLNFAKNRDYVCNFDRHCCESSDANDIRMLDNELNNYGFYYVYKWRQIKIY